MCGLKTSICKCCNTSFEGSRKKRYCSKRCQDDSRAKRRRDDRGFDWSDRNCARCSAGFSPISAKQKYCTDDCRLTHARETYEYKHTEERACVICGSGFIPKMDKHQTCSDPCGRQLQKQKAWERIGKATCTVCGQEWQPNSPVDPSQNRFNKYCSTECRSQSEEWARCNSERELKWLTSGTNYKPYYRIHLTNCRVCSKLFTARSKATQLCSDECKVKDYEQTLEDNRAKALERAKAEYVAKEVKCKCCGSQFVTEYGVKLREFCSQKCGTKYGRRVNKAKRRARMLGNEYEPIDPFKVFDRDKWTCRLCGIKTPKKLRGTIEDNAPELDHIIPLSQGGPHIYENVQCACRKCNGTKSDKIIGQIPMFLYSQTA